MTWEQVYNPMENLALSGAEAAFPLAALFYMLLIRRTPGHFAMPIALLCTFLIAISVYRMPVGAAVGAVGAGAIFGLFPIFWMILAAIFLYNLSVETGQFEIVKSSIARLTEDARLQVLLIAFAFGAFLEGAAGFGAPVAITAGMLVGLGFRPLYAAGLCLIANTAPVAFGSIGIPIFVAGQVSGLDRFLIGSMVGRQLPFLSILVPFWIVCLMVGWKKTWEVFPACLTVGGVFAVTQWATSNYLGPELPDILSSLASIVALVLLLTVWKPKTVWRVNGENGDENNSETETTPTEEPVTPIAVKPIPFPTLMKAWSPFLIMTLLILIWGIKPINVFFDQATIHLPLPGLHQAAIKVAPVAVEPTPMDCIVRINWLNTPGTAIFIAAFLSALFLGVSFGRSLNLLGRTLHQLLKPMVSVASILGLAYVMNYSGMSSTFGLLLTGTGGAFPFFSPLLGWVGVFLTGSDTSANALFGHLQTVTSHQVGMDPVLAVAANTSGGVTGKMISPLSLAVATAATGLIGKEGTLMRFTIVHSIIFAVLIGLLTLLQSSVLSWMVP